MAPCESLTASSHTHPRVPLVPLGSDLESWHGFARQVDPDRETTMGGVSSLWRFGCFSRQCIYNPPGTLLLTVLTWQMPRSMAVCLRRCLASRENLVLLDATAQEWVTHGWMGRLTPPRESPNPRTPPNRQWMYSDTPPSHFLPFPSITGVALTEQLDPSGAVRGAARWGELRYVRSICLFVIYVLIERSNKTKYTSLGRNKVVTINGFNGAKYGKYSRMDTF